MDKRQNSAYGSIPQQGLLSRLFSLAFAKKTKSGARASGSCTAKTTVAGGKDAECDRYIRVTSTKKAFGDTAPVIMSRAAKTILSNKTDAAALIGAVRGKRVTREINGRQVAVTERFSLSDDTKQEISNLDSASDELKRSMGFE